MQNSITDSKPEERILGNPYEHESRGSLDLSSCIRTKFGAGLKKFKVIVNKLIDFRNQKHQWFPRQLMKALVFISLFLFTLLISIFYFRNLRSDPVGKNLNDGEANIQSGLEKNEKNFYNILLLGYGGIGHEGGYLTDVIKIVNVNLHTRKVNIISIPRDLWVDFPIQSDKRKYFKINAAYAVGMDDRNYPLKEPQYKGKEGAFLLTKQALEKVTAMPIDYYIAIDFEGFKRSIDLLGGINVNVAVGFDDYFYPVKGLENETCGKNSEEILELHQLYSGFQLEKQFECRYEHLHFDTGLQLMDGETILKFVRSRHSDTYGGDFARAERQFAVIDAIKEKVFSVNVLDNLPSFFSQFVDIIDTNIDIKNIDEVIAKIKEPQEFEIEKIYLTTENVLLETKGPSGEYILVSKDGMGEWKSVQDYVKEQIL
ncbi:hypothetical protein A2Z22_04700 [Candidatus Woesebacteria bacterium RBG_16_34_12]|uniref:Cell envelope-related transcriptional attenuator domain-containing protein n=1 Tax=Candidatus Woesebacteria bacterium RBG_16_34_12 TaxID=1802480 RepID=A0A1F7XAF8_9BACT|nr:MAG: hypothetical protein A2Z22_04700 [Candidatus Woesebacteria bacterium RBG_16_34_12]